MKRFKNILFVSDGLTNASTALHRAISLAKLNKAQLTVVDVIDEIEEDEAITKRVGSSLNSLLVGYKLENLSELTKPFEDDDFKIKTMVLTGTTFAQIIKAVIEHHFDLVIKASTPPESLSEKLLGSTDMHLLRKCPCPVWIDKPGKTIPYKRILAAVDPLGDQSNSTKIMELSTSLAATEGAELDVVHCWHLEGESMLRGGRAKLTDTELDLILRREQQKHANQLNQLTSRFSQHLNDSNIHLIKGNAVENILEFGKQSDLIVIGTIGRVGIPGFIIGNTAEEVLQFAQSSVLAVKPDGYISPLA